MPKYRLKGTRKTGKKSSVEFTAPVIAETESDVISVFLNSLDDDVDEQYFHNFRTEPWT